MDERRRASRSPAADVRPDAVAGGWDALVTEPSAGQDAEMLRAWARSLVAMAVARLEAACEERSQRQHFELFVHRYLRDDDDPPSWRQVGAAFGLDEKTARSRAQTAARRFRALLRELVASDVGAEGDIDEEIQAVIVLL